MAQQTFSDMAPTLLKAWLLHLLWFGLAIIMPFIAGLLFLIDSPTESSEWLKLIWLLPILVVGLVMSFAGPYLYLKKRGFRNAFLISLVSVILGLVLPFGSIFGFLGAGYLLETQGGQTPSQ